MKHIQESIIGRKGTYSKITPIKDKLHWEFFEPDIYNLNYNYESKDWYMFQNDDIVLFWNADSAYCPYFFKTDLEYNKKTYINPHKWKLLCNLYFSPGPEKAYNRLVDDFYDYSSKFMSNITSLNSIYVPQEVQNLINRMCK